jgi:16S rRNA processing protein RimM
MRDEDPDADRLLIGRIARAHGNRGQVIVNPVTDFAEDRFQVGALLWVGREAAPRRIDEVRFHQGRPIVALDGVRTMDDAEALAGAELTMDAAGLAPLPPGTFYRHDLVGCEVLDARHAPVGRVVAVEGPLERSLLVVESEHGDVLIPLAADICVRVDPAARRIVVNPPDGLIELNRTKHR